MSDYSGPGSVPQYLGRQTVCLGSVLRCLTGRLQVAWVISANVVLSFRVRGARCPIYRREMSMIPWSTMIHKQILNPLLLFDHTGDPLLGPPPPAEGYG